MNVRILGARKMEAKGARHACFLIDDCLAVDAGGLTSALALDEQDRLQGVLLTHHHYDHCRDLPTLGLNLRDGGGSPWSAGFETPPAPPGNRWVARATFSAPGTYVLRCLAHDGGLQAYEDVTFVVSR